MTETRARLERDLDQILAEIRSLFKGETALDSELVGEALDLVTQQVVPEDTQGRPAIRFLPDSTDHFDFVLAPHHPIPSTFHRDIGGRITTSFPAIATPSFPSNATSNPGRVCVRQRPQLTCNLNLQTREQKDLREF